MFSVLDNSSPPARTLRLHMPDMDFSTLRRDNSRLFPYAPSVSEGRRTSRYVTVQKIYHIPRSKPQLLRVQSRAIQSLKGLEGPMPGPVGVSGMLGMVPWNSFEDVLNSGKLVGHMDRIYQTQF